MFWLPNGFDSLQLDVVGIVAILGEGSVSRNAQVLGLSWHPLLPRLMPAPQALIRHEREKRLPREGGIVVGAYSGNLRFELNWFTQLLHQGELVKNEVEVVEVTKREGCDDAPPYAVNHHGWLAFLSVLGCAISGTLLGLSIKYRDGFALIATVALSLTSSTVGMASKWKLDFDEERPQENRKQDIPDGDVVIYYPRQGAFRVVRCNEIVSRLYFKVEGCKPFLPDTLYRLAAIATTVLLILGLICLGNSRPIMQCAFAASYIVLNVAYWAVSARDPLKTHWYHNYKLTPWSVKLPSRASVETAKTTASSGTDGGIQAGEDHTDESKTTTNLTFEIPVPNGASQTENGEVPIRSDVEGGPSKLRPLIRRLTPQILNLKRQPSATRPDIPESQKNYTTALWTTIALTRSIRWLNRTHIAPDSDVWNDWLAAAEIEAKKADSTKSDPKNHTYILPDWDYQGELSKRFRAQPDQEKRRPTWPTLQELRRHGLMSHMPLPQRQEGQNPRPGLADVAIMAFHQSRSGRGQHREPRDGGTTTEQTSPPSDAGVE